MLRRIYILGITALLALGVALPVRGRAQSGQAPAKAPSKAGATSAPAPAAKAPAQASAKTPAAPAKAAPAKQAPAKQTATKPAPKAVQKPKAEKKAKKEEAASTAEKQEAPAAEVPGAHRRDPFQPLLANVSQSASGIPVHLPPGKPGLVVSTLRVDGVVRGPSGMLVVVTNPQQRTYFLRQGDRLFDGRVEQISMEGVTFREMGKDPFGHPIERTVVKRIYATAGEQ